MRAASRSPCSPVTAFAFPELATMACARPEATRGRLNLIGAPTTALVLNNPATFAGRSETSRPTSRRGSGP